MSDPAEENTTALMPGFVFVPRLHSLGARLRRMTAVGPTLTNAARKSMAADELQSAGQRKSAKNFC
jgi:hypothetical protein